MLPLDDNDWIEDFRIRLSEKEITRFVDEVGATLVFTKSKPAVAAWLVIPGVVGTVFGGLLLSNAVWASWTNVLAYWCALPLAWGFMRWLSGRLLGPAIQWQAVVLFFFMFLLGAGAMLGAWFDSRWWAYGVSGGIGLVLGLVYGSLDPTSIRKKDLWLVAGLPLGPISTVVATYLERHAAAPSTLEATCFAAGVAGLIFSAPMMALLMVLWDNARGFRQLGLLCIHSNLLLQQSVDYLTRALKFAPNDVELLHIRGMAQSRLGKLEAAEADWSRVLALDPRSAEPATHRAEVLLGRGSIPEAVAMLESTVKQHPKHARTRSSLGIALAGAGNLVGAIQHYDRAIALEPRRPSTYMYRAQALLKTGALERAIEDCDRALDVFPDFAAAYMVRGHAQAKLGDKGKAEDDFRAAQEVAPDDEAGAEASRALNALLESRHRK